MTEPVIHSTWKEPGGIALEGCERGPIHMTFGLAHLLGIHDRLVAWLCKEGEG